jgi:hypothetical protein
MQKSHKQSGRNTLPRDSKCKPPRELPQELFGCFENGVLYLDTPKWEKDDAKALQDASPFPIEAAAMTDAKGEQQEPEPAAGIFLACGFPSVRKGDERGVVLVLPALLQRDGRLVVAPDMPPVINEAYFEPQDQPRSPILGSLEDLHETQASLDWPESASWSAIGEATSEFFAAFNKSNSSLRDYVTERGKPLSVWAVPYERNDSMVLHLKALYNQLTLDADANAAALYSSICARKEPDTPVNRRKTPACPEAHGPYERRLWARSEPARRSASLHRDARRQGSGSQRPAWHRQDSLPSRHYRYDARECHTRRRAS